MISAKRARMVKEFIRDPYAWPGGYEKAMSMDDGEVLCAGCAKEKFRTILDSVHGDGWWPDAVSVIDEGPDACAICGRDMAYHHPANQDFDCNREKE